MEKDILLNNYHIKGMNSADSILVGGHSLQFFKSLFIFIDSV